MTGVLSSKPLYTGEKHSRLFSLLLFRKIVRIERLPVRTAIFTVPHPLSGFDTYCIQDGRPQSESA